MMLAVRPTCLDLRRPRRSPRKKERRGHGAGIKLVCQRPKQTGTTAWDGAILASSATDSSRPAIVDGNCCNPTMLTMGRSADRTAQELAPDTIEVLQVATRVLTGVALRSIDVLDGAVTLSQLRMLAVLADLGRARSVQVARALGLEASTVTRLADRLVAAGHVARGSEPGHRGVVTLELTDTGQLLVERVAAWRQKELARILGQLPPADRERLTTGLRQLIAAAGEGYGTISRSLVPV